MDITKQDIKTISFKNVEDFCKQKIIENLFLDYKKDKPNDLSKHIAGFSNASGGLIIIGVEEDNNGYPIKWEGIRNINKPTDWVHQMANNVVPLPYYETSVTNEVDGKVFLLIRVIEGDSTPYITRNDPTVWLRTGNIRTPIGPANREDLIQLVNKREKSDARRDAIIRHIQMQFKNLEAQKMFEYKRNNVENNQPPVIRPEKDRSMLSIYISPFSPSPDFVDIRELCNIESLFEKFSPNKSELASFVSNLKPVSNGLACLRHKWDGTIESIHINETGTIGYIYDIMHPDESDNKSIYIHHIFKNLANILLSSSLLYRKLGYNGLLVVHITLSNIQGLNIYRMSTNTRDFPNDELFALSHTYNWDYQYSTAELNNRESFVESIVEIIDKMHWDLGTSGVGKENLRTIVNESLNWGIFDL